MGLLSLSYVFSENLRGGAVAPAFRFAGGSLYSVGAAGELERCQIYYDPSSRSWCDRDTSRPVKDVLVHGDGGAGLWTALTDVAGSVETQQAGPLALPAPAANQMPHLALPGPAGETVAYLLPGLEEWLGGSAWPESGGHQGLLELRAERSGLAETSRPGPRSRLSPLARRAEQ